MKKFFAKLLMVAAIVAAVVAICCAMGAFIAGPAGVTMFSIPVEGTLATIGTFLASSSAPLLVGGVAAITAVVAMSVDKAAATDVLKDAGEVVAGVIGVVGAGVAAGTGSIGAAISSGIGGLLSNLPGWLKLALLGFAAYKVAETLAPNSDITYVSPPGNINQISHEEENCE